MQSKLWVFLVCMFVLCGVFSVSLCVSLCLRFRTFSVNKIVCLFFYSSCCFCLPKNWCAPHAYHSMRTRSRSNTNYRSQLYTRLQTIPHHRYAVLRYVQHMYGLVGRQSDDRLYLIHARVLQNGVRCVCSQRACCVHTQNSYIYSKHERMNVTAVKWREQKHTRTHLHTHAHAYAYAGCGAMENVPIKHKPNPPKHTATHSIQFSPTHTCASIAQDFQGNCVLATVCVFTPPITVPICTSSRLVWVHMYVCDCLCSFERFEDEILHDTSSWMLDACLRKNQNRSKCGYEREKGELADFTSTATPIFMPLEFEYAHLCVWYAQ